MSTSRLSLALEDGRVALGPRVSVWGARAGTDLGGVPRDAWLIVAFRPDHDALKNAGWEVTTTAPTVSDAGVVFVPKEKALARAMIAEAARSCAGPVVIDGQKGDGIDSVLKDLRGLGDLSAPISKAHGKLAVLAAGASLSAWEDPGLQAISGGFMTRLGVFSADAPDPGSVALARALPRRLGARVADLGAGWGFLARAALEREDVGELHLVEADLRALDCARLNVPDPRARFHWADATAFVTGDAFDTVVCNPPFHSGRHAAPALGQDFIAAAARLLKPGGQLWLVANRHLPYERALGQAFSEVAEAAGDRAYKIFRATRPRRERAGR